MKTTIFLILTILTNGVLGQTDCYCGKLYDNQLQNPDTIIKINGINSFAICGYFDSDYVSEFTVTKCGESEILDFYGAVLNYKIQVHADSLELVDYRFLPSNGINEFKRIPWAIDRYFLVDNYVVYEREIIYKIDKHIIFSEDFEKEWKKEIRNDWSSNNELIAWTFLISLNNTEIYHKYFEHYRDTFQIGGVYAEYYNELKEMYIERNTGANSK